MKTLLNASILAWLATAAVGWAQSRTDMLVRDLGSDSAAVRRHAVISLGRAADRLAVPPLIRALTDRDASVRSQAAKALGLIKDGRATNALTKALADADANVRTYAAYALGEIKDRAAMAALLDALRDPQWCVRDQAAWALRELRDPTCIPLLVQALKREDADVVHVVWLLRHQGAEAIVGPLSALLRDGPVHARRRAAQALSELGAAAAVTPLSSALKDDDTQVRRLAAAALFEVGDDPALEALQALGPGETDPAVRDIAAAAARKLSREADLTAYWSFDDQDAKTAKDLTDNGNVGEILGCTPVPGKVGSALAFSAGKYVELGRPQLRIGNTALTIMAWVKSDMPNGVIVARGGAWCGFSLYIKDGVPKFGTHRTREDPAYIAAGNTDVVGSWVHLAGVVKEKSLELYVNGELAATAETEGYIPGECGQGMEIGFDTANSPCEITDNFEGIIDEVKVYSAALPRKDIVKQMKLGQ